MTDEFAETDEWPAPEGWMRHQAETGLVPPIPATYTPASGRVVWRDRGERIAALEAENAKLHAEVERVREGVRALADSADSASHLNGDSYGAVVGTDDLRALLAPSPAATTGEACPTQPHLPMDCPATSHQPEHTTIRSSGNAGGTCECENVVHTNPSDRGCTA